MDSFLQAMADFIESTGEDGFIYVSFGSEADLSKAPQEFQDIFLDVFFKSKANFVWKRTQPTVSPFQHIGILSLEFHVDKLSRPLL